MKHAVIMTGGKQYRVAENDVIYVEKLNVADEGVNVFGTPVVEGATVTGKIIKTGKSKKIRVYKMKPKKNYRRTQGHRQPYTKVEITAINA